MLSLLGGLSYTFCCRSEARTVLQQAAQQPGSHCVASLYALALINAEGGHYDSAVSRAQEALEAAESAEAQQQQQHVASGSAASGVPSAPIIALVALLLSARWDATCIQECCKK
jgi:hypothetical protein